MDVHGIREGPYLGRQRALNKVINKTDLAVAVGQDVSVMERDALRMRDGGPFVFAQVKHGLGVEEIVKHVLHSWEHATRKKRQ